jgi:YHS domain-containing protein
MAKDPVCGMQVEENKPAGKTEYQGKIYYFCSTYCKAKFDRDPQQYAHKQDAK